MFAQTAQGVILNILPFLPQPRQPRRSRRRRRCRRRRRRRRRCLKFRIVWRIFFTQDSHLAPFTCHQNTFYFECYH